MGTAKLTYWFVIEILDQLGNDFCICFRLKLESFAHLLKYQIKVPFLCYHKLMMQFLHHSKLKDKEKRTLHVGIKRGTLLCYRLDVRLPCVTKVWLKANPPPTTHHPPPQWIRPVGQSHQQTKTFVFHYKINSVCDSRLTPFPLHVNCCNTKVTICRCNTIRLRWKQ